MMKGRRRPFYSGKRECALSRKERLCTNEKSCPEKFLPHSQRSETKMVVDDRCGSPDFMSDDCKPGNCASHQSKLRCRDSRCIPRHRWSATGRFIGERFIQIAGSVESIAFHNKWWKKPDHIFSTFNPSSIIESKHFPNTSFTNCNNSANSHSKPHPTSRANTDTGKQRRDRRASNRLAGLRSKCERSSPPWRGR